jgi:hypothetical protein
MATKQSSKIYSNLSINQMPNFCADRGEAQNDPFLHKIPSVEYNSEELITHLFLNPNPHRKGGGRAPFFKIKG